MGESRLIFTLPSEAAFTQRAGEVARCWAGTVTGPLLVGLQGALGTGKTTWVRGMLHGLGHRGRVPSPTYTLLEEYAVHGVRLVHLDLYRLERDEELETLGIRDWLSGPDTWLLAEWPERAPLFAARCDLRIAFEIVDEQARRVSLAGLTVRGAHALSQLLSFADTDSSYSI